MEASNAEPPRAVRWVILVSRAHPDVYEHLCRAFAGDGKVQVVLERRTDDSRNPQWVSDRLRRDGVVVIRVPPNPEQS